jgi:hypothetical protein
VRHGIFDGRDDEGFPLAAHVGYIELARGDESVDETAPADGAHDHEVFSVPDGRTELVLEDGDGAADAVHVLLEISDGAKNGG